MKNFVLICWILGVLSCCYGYPIDPGAMVASSTVGLATLGLVFLVLSVVFLIGCACCRNNQGFKQFRDSTSSLNQIGFTNRLAAEVSIFPPPGVSPIETRTPLRLGPPPSLPTKPAAFSLIAPDVSDWLADPAGNYPRQNLFYQRELGKGWFGKVVEGEAKGVKVVVRILREDATPQEKAHFLHEARPFRDLRHRNVASLYGKCVDQDPFLLLFNLCNNGDLKSFLVTNSGSKAVLNEQGICLRMMTDIAEGLNYMIENNFIHTDLAARNCLVSSDLTVKIGDYGTGIDIYRDEYYITENVAIPIRWCAPETLHCTPTTIEAKQVTSSANVWSLAVVLWEVAEFGRLPYDNLTDDQVIIRVFGNEQLRLSQPDAPYGPFLYNILQLCWKINDRASMSQILSMLHYMRTNPHQENEFEARWRSTKPNNVARVDNHVPVHSQSADIQAVQAEQRKFAHSDNHTPLHSPRHTELALRPQLTARLEFDSGVDLEMKATESSTTPTTLSPQLSVTSDEFLQSKKSASLTNLQGSLEEVHHLDSWLEGVEQNTEEDRTFVKDVSQAIKNLDQTLADEDDEASKPLVPAFRLGPLKSESSSSDTEEETWRTRIERGEFSEKVKEKSKSVTDLMVLTHIESEGSESDSLPSLTRQYSTRRASLGKPAFTSIGFGSEGNIRSAVLSEELQHKLKQLSLWKSPVNNEESQAFLAKVASETTNSKSAHKTPPFLKNLKFKPLKTGKNISADKPCVNKSENEKVIEPMTDVRSSEPQSLPVYLDNKICDVHREEVNLSESSQKSIDDKIPQITVTETNMPNSYLEPQSEVDTDFLTKGNLRKMVFVYKDDFGEEDDSSETASQHDGEMPVSDLAYDNIPLKEESASDTPSDTQNTSVILGSCEHYTLDYFKGLKTMFVPPDSSSDDGSYRFENNEDVDFINDDCHPHINEDDLKCCDSQNVDDDKAKCQKHRDSMDDLLPDSLTASVTTISTSSGYATSDKEKLLKQDYSYLSDDHSFSPSRDSLLGKSDSLSWDKIPTDKQSTELFLSSEKSMNSLNLLDDEKHRYLMDGDESPRKFIVGDIISQNVMIDPYCSSYFPDSDRISQQEYDIKELKTRLEDAMKINNDYHLVKRSEEESFGKIATPDDERSSDSGFRDKGSLSESAEDTCDEKYNIEDIDAELDEYGKCDNYHSGREDWNSWLPQSIEYEPRESVALDAGFLDALRSELKNKLPQATQCHPDDESTSGSKSPDSSPEPESMEGAAQFGFPSRLSPILEERESNQSSLAVDDLSPYRLLDDSRFDDDELANRTFSVDDDIGNRTYTVEEDSANRTFTIDSNSGRTYSIEDDANRAYLVQTPEDRDSLNIEDLEDGAQFTLHSGTYPVEEDVLVVDMETNEATLIESPKPHSHLAFSPFSLPVERYTEDYQNSNDPLAYLPPRDSANLSPDISISSPEQGNLSGFFLSPCSIRSDLFDSGPPSLPFDVGQSIDEVDDFSPTHPCEVRKSASSNTLVGDDFGFRNSCDVSPALTLSASPKLQSDDLSPVTVKENLDIVEALHHEMSDTSNNDITAPNDISPMVDMVDLPINFESLSYDPIERLVQQSAASTALSENDKPLVNKVDEGLLIDEIFDGPSAIIPASVIDNNSTRAIPNDILSSQSFIECPTDKCSLDESSIKDVGIDSFNQESGKQNLLFDHLTSEEGCIQTREEEDNNITGEFKTDSKSNLSAALQMDGQLLPDLISSDVTKTPCEAPSSVDHKKAESQIDLLLTKESPSELLVEEENKSKITDAEVSHENEDIKSNWLAKLLSNTDCSGVDPSGWPSPEELVVTSLSSTIALTSPSGEYPTLPLTPCSPVGGPHFPSSPTPPLQASSLASPDDSTSWRPTISQLMDMASDGDAAEEMTTSFIEPDENGTYTPDWESDTSESSSSGEFIWKDGEREDSIKPLLATPDVTVSQEPKMERIDEEDEDATSCSGSEGSCTSEFIPSTWDSSLIPCKPALRQIPFDFSPSKIPSSNTEKKKVVFKKEKYQCIYEYPREPASDDEEDTSAWHTTSTLFDYFDWELGDAEFLGPAEPDSEEDSSKEQRKDCNFYRLNYNSNSFDEGDVLISGSGQSQFFPGAFENLDPPAYFSPSACDLSPTEPQEGTKDATCESEVSNEPKEEPKEPVVSNEPVILTRELLTSAELGVLRHTKDSLKLDLKPCQPDRGEATILDSGIDTC